MTAKEYLSQVLDLEKQIEAYVYEIERLETLATKTTGSLQNDKVQVTVDQQKMENAVAKLVDCKNKMANTLEIYSQDKERIRTQIDGIEDPCYRVLLWSRYVAGKTFEQIAVDMHYSYRHTTRMHGAALHAFADKYCDEI